MKKKKPAKAETAATKTVASAAPIAATNPWEHWWKRSPFMVHYCSRRDGGIPGEKFWYEGFWKPRVLSAWAYELVRRLAKLKLKQPQLSANDKALLRSLPLYLQLTSKQKRILSAAMASQFENDAPGHMLGHAATWQQGEFLRLGGWHQIEALDQIPASAADPEARKLACDYIRRYWPLIRAAWMFMQAGTGTAYSEKRPQHDLSDCKFTQERLAELWRASGKPPPE